MADQCGVFPAYLSYNQNPWLIIRFSHNFNKISILPDCLGIDKVNPMLLLVGFALFWVKFKRIHRYRKYTFMEGLARCNFRLLTPPAQAGARSAEVQPTKWAIVTGLVRPYLRLCDKALPAAFLELALVRPSRRTDDALLAAFCEVTFFGLLV